ncbi:MAG: hypothetical protein LKI80_15870 [Sporolactobacillus sp.]|jgi:putative aldouronate transport system substrate-binding protein|nr:hypothetical protein [Sporolactobacillus sp.]
MKKLFGRITTLAICTLTVAGLLGGCGTGSDSDASGPTSKLKNGKYDPPITMTIAKQQDENAGKYINGESLNNNVWTKWAKKHTGIIQKTTLLGGNADNYNTKLRLALTGSQKLPDVLPVYDTKLMNDLIESGRVKDVSQDIEKYMPERLKKIYRQYPQSFNPVVKDGKIYGLAIAPNLTEGEVMFIRQDWLDKLHLKAPTTIAEFEKVIAAFTNDDPDGDGKKDTYGWAVSGKATYNTGWVSDPVMAFSAYSGKNLPNQWTEENGKLVYGSVQPGIKQGLSTLRKWYSKGYLNKELGTQDAWTATEEFVKGKAGIIVARPWFGVTDLLSTVKGSKVQTYPLIKGVNGGLTYQQGQINDGVFMFNKNFKYMKGFFLLYDKLYDEAFGTGDFKYGYAKGYDYDIVNGKVTYDPTKFNKPLKEIQSVGKMTFAKNSPITDGPGKTAYELEQGKKLPSNYRTLMYKAMPNYERRGYAISYENRANLLPNAFNGAPTETMQSSWEQLQTLESETFTKIIYGRLPLSAYDKFVKDWNAKGGSQITKEVNQWSKSVDPDDILTKTGLK